MTWMLANLRRLHGFVAIPQVLALIITIDIAAYFGGLLYWYGSVMADPGTPMYIWPFIPDCPLFGLLGGIGLLMVTAQRYWSEAAQRRAQRTMLVVGFVSLMIWATTMLPGVPEGWAVQSAMLAIWTASVLLGGFFFRKAPIWLLVLFAFGQIKYGIWTITAWLLFWRSTAIFYGAPLFTFDSVFMTITHIGLLAQGVLLLTYFRPTIFSALVSLFWFGLSDYVDYGLGHYPAIPEFFIPLSVMKWSTITVTILLSVIVGWMSTREEFVLPEPSPPAREATGQLAA